MPLNVTIDINGKPLRKLYIARLQPLADEHQVSTYLAEQRNVESGDGFPAKHVTFKHRYSDGVEICVLKAMEALQGR